MSGGYFNYQQYRLNDIAEEIEQLIRNNDDETLDKWGDRRGYGFSTTTIKEFQTAVRLLRQAEVYAQRIDWLVSGDDGEDAFHKRLKEDLEHVGLRPIAVPCGEC